MKSGNPFKIQKQTIDCTFSSSAGIVVDMYVKYVKQSFEILALCTYPHTYICTNMCTSIVIPKKYFNSLAKCLQQFIFSEF
jgi:hypothetical protein